MYKSIALVLLSIAVLQVTCAPVLISQSFQGNDFNDVDGWTVVNAAKIGFNVCSGVKIFGGDGMFGSRATGVKLFQLPPHHTIQIKVQFWKVDSWDNEQFHIWVDDQVLFNKAYAYNQGKQLCGRGGDWNEEVVNIDVTAKHTGPSAVVVFTSTLDEGADNESWGIRDFQLLVEKCPEGCSACAQGESAETCGVWNAVVNYWTAESAAKISLEGWNLAGGKAESTVCAGVPVFGGFDKLGSNGILTLNAKLPPHYRIKVKTMVLKIDSWDNEFVSLKIQGVEVYKRHFQWHEGYFGALCGSGQRDWRELMVRVEVEAAHTGSTASFELRAFLDEAPNNESVAYRDFYIFIAKCADNCGECTGPKPADCKQCLNNWVLQDGACKPLANFVLLEQSFLEDKFVGVNDWVLKGNKGGKTVSECDKSMVGGFDIFGVGASASKEFQLPGHKRLRLAGTIYKIDSWDNEWMFVRVDGVDIWKRQWNLQTGGANFCGQGVWWDGVEKFDEIIIHTAPKALVLLTSTLDQDAADESWGFRDFRIFYEPKEECATFYTECDFKGASFEFCSKSPNFPKDNIPPQIRSIKVPPQGRVTLYENAEYEGKKVVYTKDQPCIQSFDFSMLQLSGDVEARWIEYNPQ